MSTRNLRKASAKLQKRMDSKQAAIRLLETEIASLQEEKDAIDADIVKRGFKTKDVKASNTRA